ncbi:MAG TPA: DUF2267 domain-containing protein [Dissulfurispiraceae bacterium]
MLFDEFIELVQSRALFNSAGETVKAMRDVLEVLGIRLSRGAAERLAAQLPPEIRPFLLQSVHAEGFGLEEFLKRISIREGVGVSLADVESHARAVLSVIAENIPPRELRGLLAELPDELRGLFAPVRIAAS